MTTTDWMSFAKSRATTRRQFSRILITLVLFTIPNGALAEAGGDDQAVIAPDPALQAAIAQVLNASTGEQQREGLDHLVELDSPSHQQLVRQLVYFASRAENTEDAMVVGVIIRRLGIPDVAVVRALTPYLESTDLALAKCVRNILGGFEKRAAGRQPDFSIYREIIANRLRADEELPDGLIRYMYDADPGAALLTLMRAHQLREPEELKVILWAEHVVSDVLWKQRHGFLKRDEIELPATEELARLAVHEAWWVRLYVAEITRQHPAFCEPTLIKMLARDEHHLVREAVYAAEPRSD
jgi:hypothetical protein